MKPVLHQQLDNYMISKTNVLKYFSYFLFCYRYSITYARKWRYLRYKYTLSKYTLQLATVGSWNMTCDGVTNKNKNKIRWTIIIPGRNCKITSAHQQVYLLSVVYMPGGATLSSKYILQNSTLPKPFDNKHSHSICCHLAIGAGTESLPIQ